MKTRTFTVAGRDPLLFRDGRTFSGEEGALSARTLLVPNPGTLAGFFRTSLGNADGWNWATSIERAKALAVHGPILLQHGSPVYPKPEDLLALTGDVDGVCWKGLVPEAGGDGLCDSPDGMLPLKIDLTTPRTDEGSDQAKPDGKYKYLTESAMHAWLADGALPPTDHPPIEGPECESRVHVKIDRDRRSFEKGKLFSTQLVDFAETWSLRARVETDVEAALPSLVAFGGEQRLAHVTEDESADGFACPESVANALKGTKGVRLVLATPALFAGGWRPGWTEFGGVGLQLVAAAVGRRVPLSGWSFEQGKRGPKALRWMVPAGSVYFFEVTGGDAGALARQWLRPVSDDEQDGRDGHGLALWGTWKP